MRASFFSVSLLCFITAVQVLFCADVKGAAFIDRRPLKGAHIILWKASEKSAAEKVEEAKSGDEGDFSFSGIKDLEGEGSFYVTAQDPEDTAVALLSVMGPELIPTIVINELTTVASIFTHSRFMKGSLIEGGSFLGLKVAAKNVPSLVDPATGLWGKTVLDGLNLTINATLARLNTLASLITFAAKTGKSKWRDELFKLTQREGLSKPTNTIEALSGIALAPWESAKELFTLFNTGYFESEEGKTTAPISPYLFYPPPDFSLMLRFSEGGIYSPGKLALDQESNLWTGMNWLAGSQSSVAKNLGGGTAKLSSSGQTLSPHVFGFSDVTGIGWGTAVVQNSVWIAGLDGSISILDLNGNIIVPPSDFPLKKESGNLMGIGVSKNNDVWIADGTKNQLFYFKEGDYKAQKQVKPPGLKSPFGVAIDKNNHVWVSNSLSNTVVRFLASDPTQIATYTVGHSARGIALDSKGNLWVASLLSPDMPMAKIPDGLSIMKQFQYEAKQMSKTVGKSGKSTGVINRIRPEGKEPVSPSYTGEGSVNIPWGLAIDGNDDVWIANFGGEGVVLMKGAETKGSTHLKEGEAIHHFQCGCIQKVTDVVVDAAGNVWAANNWNHLDAALADTFLPRISTQGGGNGVTIIYGVAAPVSVPLKGAEKN